MIAIETRFLGPTNHRESRIVARCMEKHPARKVIVQCEDYLNMEENHKAAAIKLIVKLGWVKPHYRAWMQGATEGGYVFVCNTHNGNVCFDVQGAK